MALKASLGATVEYLLNKQQQKQVKKKGKKVFEGKIAKFVGLAKTALATS